MPVASSCSWYNADTLVVTTNKLPGKTNYITVSDQDTRNNTAIKQAATASANSTAGSNLWAAEVGGMVVEEDPNPPGSLSPFFVIDGNGLFTGFNDDGNKLKALYHRWVADDLDDPDVN